ncbi:hypothetical protein EJ02DRAFT_514176 [Clathrospora elynae]|uniref:HNH nuclease domain-containing protein n=1 Tax=Clathrospora elynae TaxID=706981 RepID=A0A6A5SHC3_9PLEO|nr:hypothetical protein EJ02DRAFT_514176 [Clathrospora elynae]
MSSPPPQAIPRLTSSAPTAPDVGTPSDTAVPDASRQLQLDYFRPPTAPSTVSAHGKKRRRDDDAASEASSPSKISRKSDASEFSKTFRPRLLRDYSGCCVCSNQYLLHVAHVFDKAADTEFRSNRTRGLTNLDSLGSYDNAIHLCAADHGAYDAQSPLLVIVPRYIEFFFEMERNWQHEMKKSPMPLARPPVSASTYAGFCEEEHGTFIGALYIAYPLVDYKLPGRVLPTSEFVWHGDPGAVLWHAKRIHRTDLSGSPELRSIRRRLLDLQELYEDGDTELNRRLLANTIPQAGPSGQQGDTGADAQDNSQQDSQPGPHPAPEAGSSSSTNQGSHYPHFPTTYSLNNLPSPPEITKLRRKRAASKHEDTLHKPVITMNQSCKRRKPVVVMGHTLDNQKDLEPCRWGGPNNSTEKTVQYWNAIFRPDDVALTSKLP